MVRLMPRYRLRDAAFIKPNSMHLTAAHCPAGTVIEYDGWPGPNLIPLDVEGARRQAHYENHKRKVREKHGWVDETVPPLPAAKRGSSK